MAHPHVWSEVRIDVTVNSGVVQGLWVAMSFDDIYSAMILTDAAPGAKLLDAKAVEVIRNGYFNDLKLFHYFGHLFLGKKKLMVPEPENFSATVDEKAKITYRFYLPLEVRLEDGVPLAVSFYDESYYIDMGYAEKGPVTFRTVGKGKAAYAFREVPKMSYFGGQAIPRFVFLTWTP